MKVNTLITSKFLKDFSPIPLNFDTTEINNYTSIAEHIWIRPIVGDELYDELLEQVKDNELSDENGTLLVEAIYPLLGFATVLEGLPFLWSRINETGITLGKSDNSDSVSLKDMVYIEKHLRSQVEVRKDYLIHWLDEHSESFPLYHPTDCNCNKCCNNKGHLHNPNPLYGVYGLNKKSTDLK